jgi:hypothetical protein
VSDIEFDNVIEIDGPARAYFDIPVSSPGGEKFVARILFRSFGYGGTTDEEAQRYGELFSRRLHALLAADDGGIIWWRTRPTVHSGQWRCRVATSPDLSIEQWDWLSRGDAIKVSA